MRIKIINWVKFNARKDVNNPSWFRFNHKFFEDSEFFSFTAEEKLAWLYILCECSKQNKNGVTTINHQHAHHVAGIDTTTLNSSIKKLQSLQIIERPRTRGRYADVTDPGATRHYITEQDITEQNTIDRTTSDRVRFDFESLYKKYPRKEGKQKGLLSCKSQIKTAEDYSQLEIAIDKYVAHCKKNYTEPQFIKHFATFMTSWRDWLDPTTGTTDAITGQKINWDNVFT